MLSERKDLEIVSETDFFMPDSFRIGMREDAIQIEFGEIEEIGDNKEKFTIRSAVKFTPSALHYLLTELYKTGVSYEEKYHRDIGFLTFASSEKD